jgi:hypothetical protein
LQDRSTDFEFLPIDVSLGRCQRYAFKLGGNIANENSVNGGGYYDSNYYSFGWLRSTTSPMRVAPTLVQYGTPTVFGQNTEYTGWTWGLGIQTPTASGWYLTGNKSSHGVTKAQDFFVFFPLTTDYFIFSAEL